jgi:hypothetical protein
MLLSFEEKPCALHLLWIRIIGLIPGYALINNLFGITQLDLLVGPVNNCTKVFGNSDSTQ